VTISASICRTSNASKSKLPHILVRGQTHHQGSSNYHRGSATELGREDGRGYDCEHEAVSGKQLFSFRFLPPQPTRQESRCQR
jgi:hypothetical protein